MMSIVLLALLTVVGKLPDSAEWWLATNSSGNAIRYSLSFVYLPLVFIVDVETMRRWYRFSTP
jgi:hypothetical protein